ncbi:hypothetical protein D918_03752 [Trichuris suis]|nr:hypothetical protein D918_03752 [Trichuris suis]
MCTIISNTTLKQFNCSSKQKWKHTKTASSKRKGMIRYSILAADSMERKPPCSRAVKAPLSRQKANLPSGSFIALGSRSQAADSTHTLGLKREGTSLSVGMAKKLKTKDIDTPTTSGAPSQRNSSSLSQTWSSGFSISSSLEAMETLKKGDCSTEFVEKLLCAIASQLRERSSFHPEPMLSALLCICAKCYPDLFRKATVLEAFCELLRSCSVSKGSFQAHSNLRCLICSIMMETWKEQREWPEIFAKAYVDDAMSERSWVDRQESRPFVKAILTSFGTLLPSDAAWNALLLHEEETFGHEATDLASIVSSSDTSHGNGCTLPNRFLYRIEQVQLYITEVLHEWWMRRADTIPKKVFLTIAACTGFFEVRLSASQRMDNWLQNSRAPWAVAWLLIAIWRNSSEFDQHDQEVIGHLCRIRLKSKAFTRVFSLAVKESFLTNTSKATALLSFALRNELSSNRASSHVNIIGVCFQTYEVLSTQV